jgi:DNA-binding beta-propeller fold protein YncE
VVDTFNYRIQKFDSSGTFLAKWGSMGSAPGQFREPAGIAVDAQGNVYVGDKDNNRVQKFSSSGRFICQWGGAGMAEGELNWPRGLVVDGSGYVYVVDSKNHRIQKFRRDFGMRELTWGPSGPLVRWDSASDDVYRVWVAENPPGWVRASLWRPASGTGITEWLDAGQHIFGPASTAPLRFYKVEVMQ